MRTGQRNGSVHFGGTILFIFFVCILISSWVATQYFAHVVQYQEGLGEAAFGIGQKFKVYQPFSWLLWAASWSSASGELGTFVSTMLIIFCTGTVLSLLFGFFLYYRRSLKSETPEDLHGSARWANVPEIEKMGLVSYQRVEGPFWSKKKIPWHASGPYVGAIDVKGCRKVMRYSDPAHILCSAPSRSGKGVGPVLCTLLSTPKSVFNNDIKGENYALSSGFRHEAGSLVIRLDPTTVEQKSIDNISRYNDASYWNAIDEIRIFTEYDVMDAQNLSAIIADPKGEGMEDHWVSTSYELLVGVTLHVAYFETNKTLNGVSIYLADPTFTDPEQMFNRMMQAEHDPDLKMGWIDSLGKPTKTHPAIAGAARAMLNKEEKERNSVLSTAKTKLGLFNEPIVARNTSRSDFRLNDLMNHDKPVSLYLVVPPSDKERLRPLIRLFVAFALMKFTSSMAFEDGRSVKEYRHALLMMLDELASMKKLEQLVDNLGYLAGYGITVMMFVQDRLQIKDIYGDNETLTAGCQLQIDYAPNTNEGAELVSTRTGKTTEKRQNVSYSGTRMGAMLGQMSVSEELHERNLMTSDEISRLDRDKLIIFNTGHSPILGYKLKYYEIPVFQKRAELPPPSKITIAYIDERKKLVSKWFMVSCKRIENTNHFMVCINTYSDFPELKVVLKQESIENEKIIECEYDLYNGKEILGERPLNLDDREFIAKPRGDASLVNTEEAFEMHFQVRDTSGYKFPSQTGFYRDFSIYETAARRAVRKIFHNYEKSEGKPTEPTIERPQPNSRHSGIVFYVDQYYIGIHRTSDREQVSLHRLFKLNKTPKIGDVVLIKYLGKRGVFADAGK